MCILSKILNFKKKEKKKKCLKLRWDMEVHNNAKGGKMKDYISW